MSNLKDQLEVDIRKFLDNIENQYQEDRIESLRNLFSKHIHLNTCNYSLDRYDLQRIISGAKVRYCTEAVPIFLGQDKLKVEQGDLGNLFVIEETIAHLNKSDCLKKLPKFDKREDKFAEE